MFKLKNNYFWAFSFSTLVLFAELILVLLMVFSLVRQVQNIAIAVKPGVFIGDQCIEGKLPREVASLLINLRKEEFERPRNAFLGAERSFIIPEQAGKIIDVKSTLDYIMEAPAGSIVEPKEITLDPELTLLEIESLDKLWGSYITYYGGGDRGINIQIAASSINNYLLAPGQIFSFHEAVWPITEEKGYSFAPIIVGGSVVPGRGGGICQVSSTLFNAVLRANLEIIERYPHSMPVGYVPPGRDATVSDYLDFKFRNNTDSYIIIKANTYGTQCHVEIWGS
ncbi:MAG: VanW family protein [Firmicutes bacterium]|nr:VanW family protein [Bacillota bacterium]